MPPDRLRKEFGLPRGERPPRKVYGDGGDLFDVVPVEVTYDVLFGELSDLPRGEGRRVIRVEKLIQRFESEFDLECPVLFGL